MSNILSFPSEPFIEKQDAILAASEIAKDLGPIIRRTDKAVIAVCNAKTTEALLQHYCEWLGYYERKRLSTLTYLPEKDDVVPERFVKLLECFALIETQTASNRVWRCIGTAHFDQAKDDMADVICSCLRALCTAELECKRVIEGKVA
ncbi:hypothetical protein [Agrobacterium pusense]|uniref:hypothetical protein n=1 Tax=Agrobacterium pusense TaxID=648995 RepID=UPI000D1AD0CB|nr:hypothetical protein [Agrobacterium pusense]